MATVEHCLACFEALAAHHDDREPMSLEDIQKSYAAYAKDALGPSNSSTSPSGGLAKRLPALRRLAGGSSSGSSATSSTTSLSTPPAADDPEAAGPAADTPMTSVSSLAPPAPPVTESPLFVTWNTVSRRGGGASLRGCIGTFEPQPLATGLASYALTSALGDVRFHAVAARELPELEVAVTLLTDFEDAADADDWDLGTHGLRLSFSHHGRRYGSTYLPDVAVEQGWNKEETVVSLMRKAGWAGRKDRWRDVDLKVVRYQGRKESLEYDEYKRWRDWADAQGKA